MTSGPEEGASIGADVSRWRILIVDDEPDVREIMCDYLTSVGHLVEVAPSGREAVARVREEDAAYDVALVDWNMPGIGGREVIETLKELHPETVVVVTTGDQVDALRQPRRASRWDAVVRKPFALRDLVREIDALMASPP